MSGRRLIAWLSGFVVSMGWMGVETGILCLEKTPEYVAHFGRAYTIFFAAGQAFGDWFAVAAFSIVVYYAIRD